MKNYVFACFLLISSVTHAQLDKGSKLVGLQTNLIIGDGYATYPKLEWNDANRTYGLNLVPTLGWVVERNWVIGGQATLGFLREKRPYPASSTYDIYTSYDLGIAPFTRLYLDLGKNKKWKAFGMASAEMATIKTRYLVQNSFSKSVSATSNTNLKGSIGAGLAYFGRAISVDLNIDLGVTGLRLGVYKTIPHKK